MSAMTHLQNTGPAEYRQRLRSSSDQTRLIVSRSFKRAGDMSFTIAAARFLNEVPVFLRESQSLPMFKRQMKTHLFPYLLFSDFPSLSLVKRSALRGALYKCFCNNNKSVSFREIDF